MRYAFPGLMLVAIAACSKAPPAPAARESPPVAVVPTARPGAFGPLTAAAAEELRGELRCAFEEGGRSLLIAAADVDQSNRATAVMSLNGTQHRLAAAAPGGFDALRQGGRFAGEGLRVAVIRGADRPTGTEGSRHAATLSVVAGDDEQRVEGLWSCGP